MEYPSATPLERPLFAHSFRTGTDHERLALARSVRAEGKARTAHLEAVWPRQRSIRLQRALATSDGEPEAVRQPVRACREPETAADWVRTGCHLVDAG